MDSLDHLIKIPSSSRALEPSELARETALMTRDPNRSKASKNSTKFLCAAPGSRIARLPRPSYAWVTLGVRDDDGFILKHSHKAPSHG